MPEQTEKELAPPYVPFSTFQTALNYFKEHGVPGKIDRSSLPTFSGVNQGQLLGAFRFFGMINEDFTPAATLELMVADEGDRKAVLCDLLKEKCPAVFTIGLDKASPSQFDSAMAQFAVTGTTLEKAKSFFLRAAEFAEIPLSAHLTRKRSRKTNGGQSRRTRAPRQPAEQPTSRAMRPNGVIPRYQKTVRLPEVGGDFTISGNFNFWDLSGRERTLVNKIIDELQEFEAETEKAGAK